MNSADKSGQTVIFLMGPTASGKTELAVELAEKLPCEIISVDSALIYKGMDIGTAKPDAATLERAPHRLIDILDPAESYSVARFRKEALEAIEEILAAGRIPLLVGGTMMYYRALYYGLSELPESDEDIRTALEAEAQEKGLEAMHQRLAEVDPQAAERIHMNDPQRILRALEVYELSGRPLTELQQETAGQQDFPYHAIRMVLAPSDRVVLHERIAIRFRQMLELGLLEEVESLYERGDLDLSMPSMRAVGYRQVWEYLAGELDYAQMIERGIIATRQLAKRQLTWLRGEPGLHWFDALDPDISQKVLAFLAEQGLKSS